MWRRQQHPSVGAHRAPRPLETDKINPKKGKKYRNDESKVRVKRGKEKQQKGSTKAVVLTQPGDIGQDWNKCKEIK